MLPQVMSMGTIESAGSMETIGARGAFVRVARVKEIAPGELLRVEVAGRLICLANVDGAIYAVDDDCTHISGPLDQGELEGCVLTCPLHLARFDVCSGRVLRGPARDDLPTFAVRVRGGEVFVASEPT